jgi:hypothetical protein
MTKTEEQERELEHLKWHIFIDFENNLDVKAQTLKAKYKWTNLETNN